MKLTDQVAIVTGGASGIGAATARVFAEAGIAGITIADIDKPAAEKLAEDLQKTHDCSVLVTKTDVADPQQVDEMTSDTLATFSRVDILVNNAGICPVIPWDEATLDDWHRVLGVNLTGAYLCTRAALPAMRNRKYGRIVYLSSVGAFQGSMIGHVAYGASKAGMIALMKSVAKSFATEGITANAIAPGPIDTPLADSFGPEMVRNFVSDTPMARQGKASELADAVLYLVSERSSYVTGATLHVNGGSLLV